MDVKSKIKSLRLYKSLIILLKLTKLPGLNGLSLFDFLKMYALGIVNGTMTTRAGSISFSFFMALFPFLLFILNLIPFIPIENLDVIVFNFVEIILPKETHVFFNEIFIDIQSKPRVGLLSSVFILSIFLTANGVSSIFLSFEESYHVKSTRSFFNQYIFSVFFSVLIAFFLLLGIIIFVYYEIYILNNLQNLITSDLQLIRLGQILFLIVVVYFSISTLYYYVTIESKILSFFSPGSFLTTFLILVSTYFFGVYVEKFSTYNKLYGSIGALLIFMLYTWINSFLLLLGFELNTSIARLKRSAKIHK